VSSYKPHKEQISKKRNNAYYAQRRIKQREENKKAKNNTNQASFILQKTPKKDNFNQFTQINKQVIKPLPIKKPKPLSKTEIVKKFINAHIGRKVSKNLNLLGQLLLNKNLKKKMSEKTLLFKGRKVRRKKPRTAFFKKSSWIPPHIRLFKQRRRKQRIRINLFKSLLRFKTVNPKYVLKTFLRLYFKVPFRGGRYRPKTTFPKGVTPIRYLRYWYRRSGISRSIYWKSVKNTPTSGAWFSFQNLEARRPLSILRRLGQRPKTHKKFRHWKLLINKEYTATFGLRLQKNKTRKLRRSKGALMRFTKLRYVSLIPRKLRLKFLKHKFNAKNSKIRFPKILNKRKIKNHSKSLIKTLVIVKKLHKVKKLRKLSLRRDFLKSMGHKIKCKKRIIKNNFKKHV